MSSFLSAKPSGLGLTKLGREDSSPEAVQLVNSYHRVNGIRLEVD